MSTLTANLQTIYEVKQQLKQVIGTSSDIFEDYPSYISNMVTPTGTINISENGTTNVSTYAYAYVSVSGGGTTPAGTLLIAAPGQYDVSAYAYVAVCKDCTDNYSGLLDESVGSYVVMNPAQTGDNSEAIGTLTAEIATEFGTVFGVDLTPYVGSNYAMFSDFFDSQENGYGIFIDTNAAFTAAGYPTQTPSGDPLDFYMVGQLAWKNDSASVGDVSSLVIGQASNVGGIF